MVVKLYGIVAAIVIRDLDSHLPIIKKVFESWSTNQGVVLLEKAVLNQFFAVVIITPGLAALLHPF